MKNLLISFVILLMALSLTAQRSVDFSTFNQKWPNVTDIDYFHHADVDLHKFEMKSSPVNMQYNNAGIRADSVVICVGQGDYVLTYSYGTNGNLISELWRSLQSGTWMNKYLALYVYDENDNQITETLQSWGDGAWKTVYIFTSSYDLQGNQLTELIEQYESGELINANLYTYTYDNSGNQLTFKSQLWNGIDWQNKFLTTNTFNELNKLETEIQQNWDDGAWLDYYIASYTYDSNGILTSVLAEQLLFTFWMYAFQNLYTADEYGNLDSQLVQHWDASNEVWYDHSLSMRTFNEDGLWLTDFRQERYAGVLENDKYYTRIFDSENSLTESTFQIWENDEWLNYTKVIVDFSSGLAHAQAYQWDGNSWLESPYADWLTIFMHGEHIFSNDGLDVEFYYTEATGIEEQNTGNENIVIHCFPNPATHQINIEINPAWQAESCFIELINQSGQRVKFMELSSNSKSSASIKVKNVTPGLYLLKLTAGKLTSTRKVVISK